MDAGLAKPPWLHLMSPSASVSYLPVFIGTLLILVWSKAA